MEVATTNARATRVDIPSMARSPCGPSNLVALSDSVHRTDASTLYVAARRAGSPDRPLVDRHPHRRVIGESGLRLDPGFRHARCELRCREHVVQAPADIVLTCTSAVRPPRVHAGFARMLRTQAIDPTLRDQAIEPRALFRQEARVLL